MRKRSFGLALLSVIIGITLAGCACGTQKVAQETTPAYSPAVVQSAPERQPAPAPVPPPKRDRN